MRYGFGDYELDDGTRRLNRDAATIHVEPQVFAVLAYLIAHRERAIAKSELLREIWGHEYVSEWALTSRVKSARAAVGDNGRDQRLIRTVHGFGYQFVGPVTVVEAAEAEPPVDASHASGSARAIPTFLNPFRGRHAERADLTELVASHRLVTVLGPGGMGKTRLAVELLAAVDRAQRPFDLPVLFVELAATRDEESIPHAIATTLGIEIGQRRDPTDAVCEYLATIPHLVVLDNCEHVLSAAAEITAQIMRRTTATRVLATSRMPLGVDGERLYRLGPLPVPAAGVVAATDSVAANPSAAIFLDRARLADPEVLADDGDAQRVAELCRALDGLPLALELAAGRVAAFGLADLVGLLDRPLDVIGDRSVTRERRHRTLRATVEWSYDLLEASEQRLFRFLSVFPAGVTLRGIQWIATQIGFGASGLDAAGHLVDASLVMRRAAGSDTRYAQLETLRAFGLDQLHALGEVDDANHLLAVSMLELVERVDRDLRTSDEPRAVDLLREEFPNLRAAQRLLADQGRTDDLIHMLRHLTHWARLRDANEVWAWSDELVSRVPCEDPRHADVRAIHAQAAWRRGDINGAIADGLVGLGGTAPWAEAQATAELATAHMFAGDLDAAEREWLRHAEIGDPEFGLASAAIAVSYAGRFDDARRYIEQVRARPASSVSSAAWLNYAAAETSNTSGIADLDSLEQAIDQARSVDATFIVGVAMVTLASIHAAAGDIQRAADRYEELIRHWLRSGSWTQQWTTLRHVADLVEDSHPDLALTILRAAGADPLSPSLHGDAASADALMARLVARVGDSADEPAVPRLVVAERARTALIELGAAAR